MSLYTVGHSYLDRHGLTVLLHTHRIGLLLDVRSFPGSRRNPDVHKNSLADWLPNEAGIDYLHDPRLGGRRKNPKERADEDSWWTNTSFANYAAHTRSTEFAAGYTWLLEESGRRDVAIMCGEPMWWRCHRRMISDLASVDGHKVLHIMPDAKLLLHEPSDWAKGLAR